MDAGGPKSKKLAKATARLEPATSLERAALQAAVELREKFREALCDRACAERAIRFFRAGLIPRRRPGCRLSESVGIAIEMKARGENWQNVYAAAIPGYRTMDKYEREGRCRRLRRNTNKALKRRSVAAT